MQGLLLCVNLYQAKGDNENASEVTVIRHSLPKEIHSSRLILLSPQLSYAKLLHRSIAESIQELRLWMHWAEPMPSLALIESYLLEAHRRFLAREEFLYLLFEQQRKSVIGGLGVHRIDWDIPTAEFGYWLHKDYWGQGLMNEALSEVLRLSFETLGLVRVEIRCGVKNEKSQAVAERLGFALEGVLMKQRREVNGELSDTMLFAKINDKVTSG